MAKKKSAAKKSAKPAARKTKTPKGSSKSRGKTAGRVQPATQSTGNGIPMAAPKNGVGIRMYRVGLGDCFLLALPRNQPGSDGRETFYILIDCGAYFRSPDFTNPDTGKTYNQNEWIQEIARHIKSATNGRIDLLMITHEHWDHVSGFHQEQAQATFSDIELGALWLPWTEDMSIDLARKLKKEGGADHVALARAVDEMARRGMADSGTARLAEKVLGFFGAKGSTYSKKTGEAMRWIQEDYANKYQVKPKYLHPGAQVECLDGVDPDLARIYVLGPPEDERVIKVLDRSGTTYRMGIDWSLASACFAAFGVVPSSTGDPLSDEELAQSRRMSVPFDLSDQIPLAAVRAAKPEALQQARSTLAGGGTLEPNAPAHPLFRNYLDDSASWRKIDDDWAAPAGAFALQLDNKTNNTSLAFALEIGPPGKGKVLLFPGDAQIGNWLSWFGPVSVRGADEPVGKTLAWTTGNQMVTAEDLLQRTVFYKVGHHGSHNATLFARDKKPSGLKLMGSPDGTKEFVAMIPVDEYVARNKANYGEMPLPAIVEDLLRRTKGKVARNDEDAQHTKTESPTLDGSDFPQGVPSRLSAFPKKQKTGLFIEYSVEW